MIMKKHLLSAVCFFVLTGSAWGADRASGYEEALKKATEDGVIVYCYGPDWNRRSVWMLDDFWKNRETEKACGGAVMVAVPFYQRPSASQRKEENKIQGGFQRQKINHQFRSFPAVCMADARGRIYAQLCGTDELGSEEENYETGRENIRCKLELFREQSTLLAQAENAQGMEKARLLGEACSLNIYPPDHAVEQLRALDPQDSLGYIGRLTYDPFAFNMEVNAFSGSEQNADRALSARETEKKLKALLENPRLSDLQKQESYAVFIGRLRKEKAGKMALVKHVKAMGQIAPDTMYGKIVPHLLEIWCGVADRSKSADDGASRGERSKARRERREQRRRR